MSTLLVKVDPSDQKVETTSKDYTLGDVEAEFWEGLNGVKKEEIVRVNRLVTQVLTSE